MGADYSNNQNSNIGNEEIKLKELSPSSIFLYILFPPSLISNSAIRCLTDSDGEK